MVIYIIILSDYFLDPDMIIGLSAYVTDCVKNNKIPDFVVVTNPFFVSNQRRRSSSFNYLDQLNNHRLTNSNIGNSFKNTITKNSVKNIRNFTVKRNEIKTENKIIDDSNIIVNPSLINTNFNDKLGHLLRNKFLIIQDNILNSAMNQNYSESTKINKLNIKNIAVFNPEIIKFSEFKGIRNRGGNLQEEINLDKDLKLKNVITSPEHEKIYTNNIDLDLDKIILSSIKKKLVVEKEKSASQLNVIEVDVDNLMEGKRQRTKVVRVERSNTPIRATNYGKNRNLSSEEKNNNLNNKNVKNKSKIEDYITMMDSNISLKNISRPFNLKIHMVRLRDSFIISSATLLLTPRILNLEIEVQMFCGMDPITESHKLFWKGISSDVSALIRQKLNFDIKYCNLPLVTSLIFKIKTSVKVPKDKEKKEGKTIEKKTIAWVNFKLFDHLKRLKTGLHKVSLWDTKFSDDSYFTNVDNFLENTGEIFFELETFMRPVEYQNPEISNESEIKPALVSSISFKDNIILGIIEKKSPFEDLTDEEKEVLWRNRTALTNNTNLIPKILSCVNKKDVGLFSEIDKLLSMCKPIPPVNALQLLSGNFLHDSIRFFAVYSFQQVSSLEIIDYLPQLVQCLKYEMYHDSALANFLLKIGIRYPLTIGHQLFWLLKAEMSNTNIQQRFGLYLQIFLNKIGSNLRTIFEDEIWLLNNLLKIADLAFIKNKTSEEKNYLLQQSLEKLDSQFGNRFISIAYNFKLRVKGIIFEKCKFMKSKKKPLWLVFKNSDEFGEDISVIFKKGDDLRQDVLTLQLFKIMNNLWFKEGIKLKMSIYNVISTGYYQGMLQVVTNSETLATVHKEYGAFSLGFSDKPLKHWMSKVINNLTETEYVNNFLLSCAAYCVATFVLGIGDRHNDNIMIKKNGEIFHIDFGHFLGHFKYKFGIKRERAPFVFTSEFCNVLGGEKSENFHKFKDLCLQSYQNLRKNAQVLITILKVMLCTGIPELTLSSIKFLENSLALKLNDKEAEKFLLENLEKSLNSLSTKFNFAFHIIANK